MNNRSASVKVAVVQAAPVLFDLKKTIDKVCEIMRLANKDLEHFKDKKEHIKIILKKMLKENTIK